MKDYPRIIPVLFMTVGFGIIGFLDDYIKIVMKRSEGLNPKQKLLGQIVITGIFAYYLMTSGEVGTEMLIPFTGGFENGYFLDLGWLFVPALFFIVLGTDNGVNFTDGLDGLCTSVTILVATFLPWWLWERRAASAPSRAPLWEVFWASSYLMYIRPGYLWEIRDLWPWEALWPPAPI